MFYNEKFIFTDSYGAKIRYTKEKIYRLHIVGENDIEIVSIGKISDMETPITEGDNSKK